MNLSNLTHLTTEVVRIDFRTIVIAIEAEEEVAGVEMIEESAHRGTTLVHSEIETTMPDHVSLLLVIIKVKEVNMKWKKERRFMTRSVSLVSQATVVRAPAGNTNSPRFSHLEDVREEEEQAAGVVAEMLGTMDPKHLENMALMQMLIATMLLRHQKKQLVPMACHSNLA